MNFENAKTIKYKHDGKALFPDYTQTGADTQNQICSILRAALLVGEESGDYSSNLRSPY